LRQKGFERANRDARGGGARVESYLERRFGDAYRAYKARVRRWL